MSSIESGPNHGYPTVDPLKTKLGISPSGDLEAQPRLSNRGPIEVFFNWGGSFGAMLPNHGYPTVDPLKCPRYFDSAFRMP